MSINIRFNYIKLKTLDGFGREEKEKSKQKKLIISESRRITSSCTIFAIFVGLSFLKYKDNFFSDILLKYTCLYGDGCKFGFLLIQLF